MKIGGRDFDFGTRTYIMGILNVTPDSFSDGGLYDSSGAAVERALQMEAEGADIIDIGGESTRPGHTPVDAGIELDRILPVLRALRDRLRIPVSVDTSKAEVADAALAEGASMINDVWGFRRDPEMAPTAVRRGAVCCLMHNKERAVYTDLCGEIEEGLQQSADIALAAGVPREHIILDPGIGFGKTPEHNIVVLHHLRRFTALGYPLLLGASRKSVIGKVLDLPVDDRLEGTLALTALAVQAGIGIVRVHDVLANRRAAAMADAVVRGGE